MLNLCIPMMPFTPGLSFRCRTWCKRHHRNAQVQHLSCRHLVVLSLSCSGVKTPLVWLFLIIFPAHLQRSELGTLNFGNQIMTRKKKMCCEWHYVRDGFLNIPHHKLSGAGTPLYDMAFSVKKKQDRYKCLGLFKISSDNEIHRWMAGK